MGPKGIGQAFIDALAAQFETLLQSLRRDCERLNEFDARCSVYDREIDTLKSRISFMSGRVGEAETRCTDLTREIKELKEDRLKSDGSFRERDKQYTEILDQHTDVFDALLARIANIESGGPVRASKKNSIPSSAMLAYRAAIDEIVEFLDERPSCSYDTLRSKLAIMRAVV